MIYIHPTPRLHTPYAPTDFRIIPVVKRKEALSNSSPIIYLFFYLKERDIYK